MTKPKNADSDSANDVTMRLVVELTLDELFVSSKNSDDQSERDWFNNDLLGDPQLLLQSNLVGDYIGTVRVVKVVLPHRDPQEVALCLISHRDRGRFSTDTGRVDFRLPLSIQSPT